MSDLRDHLESVRTAYRLVRYPGDLGRHVLPQAHRRPRIIVGVAGAIAAAVAIVIALQMNRITAPQDEPVAIEQVEERIEYAITTWPALAMPELPSDMTLAPPAQAISFPMPSFPSWEAGQEDEDLSTTQEAV